MAKRTKPSTGLERVREIEAEGVYISKWTNPHAGDLEHNDWRRGRGYMIQGLRWICFDLRAWKDEIGERPQALEGSFPHYK
ncbi:hypothetical protein Tco_0255026 [Tanacetum coccineum]